MKIDRRDFIRSSGALALASGAGATATLSPFASPAFAADTSGYKALVCVFLKGGIDCHDIILPYDEASYQANANARATVMSAYRSLGGDASRERADLLPLSPNNQSSLGSRQYAMPPSMNALRDLFQSGDAAIVGNVGPLVQPTTRSTFDNRSAALPRQLFSHNDQEATWMSLRTEGQSTGWGGRFADAVRQGNGNPAFSAISTGGHEVFLVGSETQQFQLHPTAGIQKFRDLEFAHLRGTGARSDRLQQLLEDHYNQTGIITSNYFERDLGNKMRQSIANNALFNDAKESAGSISSAFPNSSLGEQLKAVADTIAMRGQLNVGRQVFIVTMSGFDTHTNQARTLPAMQREISESIAAFYQSTIDLGLANDVTLFTGSDFGRTLTANGEGTDHGWGGHQFIVGGAVNGRTIYGEMPDAGLGHDQELGNGRLIPTTSVEQFASPLGRWFGLSQSEVDAALPTLRNFTGAPLGFI